MEVPLLRKYMNIIENQLRFPPPKDDSYESAVEIAREMFNDAKRYNNPEEWDDIRYRIAMNYNVSEEDLKDEESKKLFSTDTGVDNESNDETQFSFGKLQARLNYGTGNQRERAKEELKRRSNLKNNLEEASDFEKEKKKSRTTFAEPDVDTDIRFDDPTSKGDVGTYTEPEKEKTSEPINKELPGKKRSRTDTHAKMADVNMPGGAPGVMRNFMNRTAGVTDTVDVPDDFGIPEPQPPGTEVATISTALTQYDDSPQLNWHELKHLPGYAIEQIRGAFRPLFKEFMDVQLEDVSVVTTLDGSIDKDDLRSFMGFLGSHGKKYDDFDLEAFGIDREEYHVEKAYMYHYNGFNFLLMQEKLMGIRNWYIYAGPGHAPNSNIEGGKDKPKQISGD